MDSTEVIGNVFLLKQLQTTEPVLAFYKSNGMGEKQLSVKVYSFKMPMFKNAFKKRRRKPRRTNELRAVGANISSEDREAGLYYPSSCSLVQYKRNLSNG